ncbi:preprotein translocase subunit SecE [Campylobacter canadensis]|uniref:Protein translocase subunit SecE n=1 Tax=Campylobacter canadensis TaxID=449520 RepID=A0ABS7WQV6_9BACT|nr:preprotein translocase subunit SecE [Campylobacter canadensis]MBZ7987146.1 preprotein translocase subunit SecE [Campylobacter canadensis]MBZ7994500.1 preprotein translocase subunit SecE [Campylobacter canadensis]MBZ7996413.1 preprotein translocase subunit SecE [Campylobacter canadensis]MBZ7998230.1 preprotein translocase subunit SecE [Campylobacter canadensis]MBZ7999785.1 preprotein translocase subunit SecE [Campylobacter canadensis]
MEKIKNYFKESKLELAKVFFPTKMQVRNAFLTVVVVVSVIALFLLLIDLVASFSLSKIL